MGNRKRSFLLFIAVVLVGLGIFLPGIPVRGQDSTPQVLVMQVNGPGAPAMQLYIDRGLTYAADNGFSLVIMQLNTPGGALDTMNLIVEQIRQSPVPVVVYVSPNGAMAASAGTLITLAGHAAAMAPDTFIGAASPVSSSGQNIDTTEELKLKEAMKATVRELARNRKPEAIALAEQTIDNAKAASATEAVSIGLVDFQATSVADLVAKLDGFQVTVLGASMTLHTQGANLVNLPKTLIEEGLQIFTDPNLVFIFLSAGIWAILIEVSSPGGWVAGFVGAVLLLLALFGLGILPVNWTGLLFLVLAFILFILDIKAPTHGALTIAGTISFVAGGLILFNTVRVPGIPEISYPLVIGTGIFISATFFAVLTLALRAQSAPLLTGHQTLVGKVGLIKAAVNPKGQIQVAGELWTAHLVEGEAPLQIGDRAEVTRIEGVILFVKKAKPQE
jgi:membrane-bound serine protease (ClpP class)